MEDDKTKLTTTIFLLVLLIMGAPSFPKLVWSAEKLICRGWDKKKKKPTRQVLLWNTLLNYLKACKRVYLFSVTCKLRFNVFWSFINMTCFSLHELFWWMLTLWPTSLKSYDFVRCIEKKSEFPCSGPRTCFFLLQSRWKQFLLQNLNFIITFL